MKLNRICVQEEVGIACRVIRVWRDFIRRLWCGPLFLKYVCLDYFPRRTRAPGREHAGVRWIFVILRLVNFD
jgi:hypothetical protein